MSLVQVIPLGPFLNEHKELQAPTAAYLEPWDMAGLSMARQALYQAGIPSTVVRKVDAETGNHSGPVPIVVPEPALREAKRILVRAAGLMGALRWSWRDAELACETPPMGFRPLVSRQTTQLRPALEAHRIYSHATAVRILSRRRTYLDPATRKPLLCEDLMARLVIPGQADAVYRSQRVGGEPFGPWLWQRGFSPYGAFGSWYAPDGSMKNFYPPKPASPKAGAKRKPAIQ